MNIQILNIKTGTIKIKKQLTYTKTLQMALHTNQFLNMELLEHGVANSCKSVSKYGTVETWGCKQCKSSS